MSLVQSYRHSQKQQLLQKVLTHSLASTVYLFPRFGQQLFFEQPISNPFRHEERFSLEVADPLGELRIVDSFAEWMHLRQHCRSGRLSSNPRIVL